jgi:hypothetical protein
MNDENMDENDGMDVWKYERMKEIWKKNVIYVVLQLNIGRV